MARFDQGLVEQVALRMAAAEAVRAVADRPQQFDALSIAPLAEGLDRARGPMTDLVRELEVGWRRRR